MPKHFDSDIDNDTEPLVGVVDPQQDSSKPISILRILCIVAFQFGLQLVQNATVVLILPFEIENLFPESPAQTLGVLVASGSALPVLTPTIGLLSDRCTLRWGRRRPFVAIGMLLMCVGLLGMWISGALLWKWYFVIAFLVVQFGQLIATAPVLALVSDLVPESQRGLASGILGVLQLLGSALGYLVAGILFPLSSSSRICYLIYSAVCFISGLPTLIGVTEQRLLKDDLPKDKSVIGALKEMFSGLKHRNFFLIWLARVFVFMTLTPQIFMVYLLVDLTDSKDPAMDMTIIALSAQAAGIITSIPAGKLSDKFGRKIFVYLNTAVFIFCYQLFVFLDKVWIYYVIGATYGAAQGTYFAVEFALGVDCLPTENTDEFGMEEKKEARSTGSNMGMWVIAQAIGQVSGLYICGPLLEAVGSTGQKDHYTRFGYGVIFTVGSLASLIAAILVIFIKLPKKKSNIQDF